MISLASLRASMTEQCSLSGVTTHEARLVAVQEAILGERGEKQFWQ